jgi:hypothetical protein
LHGGGNSSSGIGGIFVPDHAEIGDFLGGDSIEVAVAVKVEQRDEIVEKLFA